MHGTVPQPAVWFATTIDRALLDRRDHSLSEDELAHARRLAQPRDRDRYLSGRLLARALLSAMTGDLVKPRAWRFGRDRLGKPVVGPQFPIVHFNIAHAADVVAVAADTQGPVGIDVERLDMMRVVDLPESVLSRRERAALALCPADIRGPEFLKLWTLKEAIAKQSSEGVSLDFAALEPNWRPGSGTTARRVTMQHVTAESRTVAMAGGNYQISAAGIPGTPPMLWRQVDLATLVQVPEYL
jgi:4'-phosphopantetheinyl transferase